MNCHDNISFNHVSEMRSGYQYCMCMNKGAFPKRTLHMYVLQSSQGGACIPTPWTSLQEECVEEANDMTKQGNGSIHTCKHREVGHSLAQYDHSGCGHWRGERGEEEEERERKKR